MKDSVKQVLIDARAMLTVYVKRQEIETTRGQAIATIRDIERILGNEKS